MIINPSNPVCALALCYARAAGAPAAESAWSTVTHVRFPAPARARAVELLLLGTQLGAAVLGGGSAGACLREAWLEGVMPLCVSRDRLRVGCHVWLSGLRANGARWNGREARVVSYTTDGSRVRIVLLRSAGLGGGAGCRQGHLGVAFSVRDVLEAKVDGRLLARPCQLHVAVQL